MLSAAPSQSPATATGSAPAKFWFTNRGWLVWTDHRITESVAAATSEVGWAGSSSLSPSPTERSKSARISSGSA